MTEKSMARTAHVVRRGAVYYFRLRTPSDLLAHYGKNEITFSLKTKDAAEAKLKAAVESLRLQGEFNVLRQAMRANVVQSLTAEDIRKASLSFAHAMLAEDEEQRIEGNIPESYLEAIDVIESAAKEAVAGDDNRSMTSMVRNFLEDQGIKVEPQSSEEKRLVYAIAQASVQAIESIRLRESGNVVLTPAPAPLAPKTANTRTLPSGDILLSTLIERYCIEQEQAGNWQDKTSLENRTIYRLFQEIVGDIPVSSISYPIMREYKAKLIRLPPNMNKDRRYREKSLDEILALPDVEPMSTSTVNKHLIRISSLSDWAMKHGYLDKNYADGLSVTQRNKKVNEDRLMFEHEHLTALFKNIAQGKTTRTHKRESFHYWMPLLGLMTGARINELASLRPQDFVEVDGVQCISISQQNDGEKGTKTASGQRAIAIHPELIRLGLLEHVKHLQSIGHTRLFPELPLTRNGYGGKVTKWFSGANSKADGFLWRSGVTADKLSFHSFRHTTATMLERAGVEPLLIKRILGHALDDVTFGRYSKGGTQEQYLQAIQQAIPAHFTANLPRFKDWITSD